MKANELMIGDWVLFATRLTKINGIAEGGFSVNLEREGWQSISAIEPIPLTAEILEKNGFEKDPESGELIWTDDDVTEVVWVGTILTIRGEYANAEFATCMFVHQLQHALRLCGIEKELEL